jgi:hypothetical protein
VLSWCLECDGTWHYGISADDHISDPGHTNEKGSKAVILKLPPKF